MAAPPIRRHHPLGFDPDTQAKRTELRRAAYFANRAKTDLVWQFYHTKEWHSLRNKVLRANRYCVECGAPANHVDHITPIKKDWSRRLDITNLQPMCHSCHSSKTLRERNVR